MEEDLISKKELLDTTGISYGQLYRWKRKKLIPEEWFIRKSTFTGQETFFPRREILARIERIKDMKDDLSLDELADVFSPNPADVHLSLQEVSKRNIVMESLLQLFESQHGNAKEIDFMSLLAMYVADVAVRTGDINLVEARDVMDAVETHVGKFHGKPYDLVFARKLGVGVCVLIDSSVPVHFDPACKLVARIPLATCIEQLKMTLP